ncbi:unnamed protein product [Didymodactylos carnosus]|uniref:Uncharacterized protein n=1 Tax=Didymodactylos carnosus TaxID=1234261 RepID=A0A813WT26_9BILA|nr:unnamed protein product [Didymodactylos carnosus]CAF1008167.1 unnamed protein product [Didymodactylos carnosus]CAF3649391.1 unnamed protein product [Didymodactylos carnosus]CAF3777151.1 unnamed protein product [Didymodactylos carnosus]
MREPDIQRQRHFDKFHLLISKSSSSTQQNKLIICEPSSPIKQSSFNPDQRSVSLRCTEAKTSFHHKYSPDEKNHVISKEFEQLIPTIRNKHNSYCIGGKEIIWANGIQHQQQQQQISSSQLTQPLLKPSTIQHYHHGMKSEPLKRREQQKKMNLQQKSSQKHTDSLVNSSAHHNSCATDDISPKKSTLPKSRTSEFNNNLSLHLSDANTKERPKTVFTSDSSTIPVNISSRTRSLERGTKTIGIVKPTVIQVSSTLSPNDSTLITSPTSSSTTAYDSNWSCDELEKLQRRFSELLDTAKTCTTSNVKSSIFNDITNGNEKCAPKALQEETDGTSTSLSISHIEKIQSLYTSMGSQVVVSACKSHLYLLSDKEICQLEHWKYLYTGYCVWLLDSGLNPKRPMKLRLLLTEPETGFILWSDTIVNKLTLPKEQIFSFRHSTQNGYVMVKFDQGQGYYDFYKFYTQLTKNQNYKLLFSPFNATDIKPKKLLQNIKRRMLEILYFVLTVDFELKED